MTKASYGLESQAFIYGLFVICAVALLLNLYVLVRILHRNMHSTSTTYSLVANLSLAFLLLSGISIPIELVQATRANNGLTDFTWGNSACKVIRFIPTLGIGASIATMVALSCDRYMSIVRSVHLHRRGRILTLAFIWIIAAAISSPQLYEYSVDYNIKEHRENMSHVAFSCGSHNTIAHFETIYAAIVVLVIYIIPLFVITINYINICVFIWHVAHQTEQSMNGGGHISHQKIRVVKMLALIAVLFALLWLPYFVLFTIEEVTGTDDSSKANTLAHSFKKVMVALSTITNPLINMAFNPRLRPGELANLFRCHGHQVQPEFVISVVQLREGFPVPAYPGHPALPGTSSHKMLPRDPITTSA